MIELSKERIDKILHEETAKTEELLTILRSIYIRYVRLFEKYMDDIDALNDDEIARLRNYHEETLSLIKNYYLDIPYDICKAIEEFEDEYCTKMLGAGWHEYMYEKKHKEELKAEFKEHVLKGFYSVMDCIFRGGFNTESESTKDAVGGIAGLLFGQQD